MGQGGAAGQGQYGPGPRSTGSWQAAGPAAAQGWAGQGQQPYEQSHPGQYPGQQQSNGKLGDPQYGDVGPGTRNTGGFGRVGAPFITQRDSALPDQPPPSVKGPIAALELDSVAGFARDLRVLRAKADLDYPDMAEKSHYTMRTLASAAGGLRLPTLPVLIAYVNACGGDVAEWEKRWGKLTESGKKALVALPAAGQAGEGAPAIPGQVPQDTRQPGEIYVITSAKSRDDPW